MINLDYTVVRYTDASEGMGFEASDSGGGGTVSVDHVEATAEQVADIKAEEGVHDVAATMPISLVEPEQSEAQPEGEPITWGVRAVGADTSPLDGKGVTVAVLDTGIDASHPAFSSIRVIEEDFTGEGNGDAHGHGTHCAGTIVGADVDGMRIGIARNVDRLLAGKVLGTKGGTSKSLFDALYWAIDNGAQVISMSLGIDFPGMVERLRVRGVAVPAATSIALASYRDNVRLFDSMAVLPQNLAAFDHEADGRGAVVFAATGNQSLRKPRPGTNETYVIDAEPPATANGIVAIGALALVEDDYDVAPFSNANPDISAPGVDVISAAAGGGLRAMSGTSMATPHAAGVAALWAQQLTQQDLYSIDRLRSAMIGRARKLGLTPGEAGSGLAYAPQE